MKRLREDTEGPDERRDGPCRRNIPVGEGRTFAVGDEQIAVFRLRDGWVHAVDAVCPHKGGPLADGLADDRVVVCPLHSHTFDMCTGAEVSGGGDVGAQLFRRGGGRADPRHTLSCVTLWRFSSRCRAVALRKSASGPEAGEPFDQRRGEQPRILTVHRMAHHRKRPVGQHVPPPAAAIPRAAPGRHDGARSPGCGCCRSRR